MTTGDEPGDRSWRSFWVRARWWARALRSRRRRVKDQDGFELVMAFEGSVPVI
jgi:hypothetical protein